MHTKALRATKTAQYFCDAADYAKLIREELKEEYARQEYNKITTELLKLRGGASAVTELNQGIFSTLVTSKIMIKNSNHIKFSAHQRYITCLYCWEIASETLFRQKHPNAQVVSRKSAASAFYLESSSHQSHVRCTCKGTSRYYVINGVGWVPQANDYKGDLLRIYSSFSWAP